MGVCYSSIGGKNERREEDRWWKEKDDDVNAAADAKLKKGVSGDFSSFIGKFMGGGGGGSAALSEKGLPHIPGRLFASGASRIASLYTQQGKKGTNQDAMIVWENFSSRSDAVFCGVFDGHGPYGHMVARKVRDCLPLLLRTQWDAGSNGDECSVSHNENSVRSMHFDEVMDEDWCESFEFEDKEKLPEKYLPLKQSILDSFKLMDKELSLHPTIDCFCSGTTAVTVIKQDQDLIIGNVGDSRAVLAKRDKDNSLMALQLTIDLKPNLPREAARIQKYKGRVFALQDEPEVSRVWLPNSDSPGLAMARAFGDFCLKNFGLISVPDIYYHHITERDEFIVLASDGVWDVLSNKEAVDIVASAPGQETAARALVDCATRAWRLKYPTSKIDDCAVICLFLEHVVTADIEHSTLTKDLVEGSQEELKRTSATDEDTRNHNSGEVETSSSILGHCGTFKESGEITPATDEKDEKITERSLGPSKRSLAECLSTAEDEEWSALEGVARVNSLLSLPRFLSADKRSTSWRKWL